MEDVSIFIHFFSENILSTYEIYKTLSLLSKISKSKMKTLWYNTPSYQTRKYLNTLAL